MRTQLPSRGCERPRVSSFKNGTLERGDECLSEVGSLFPVSKFLRQHLVSGTQAPAQGKFRLLSEPKIPVQAHAPAGLDAQAGGRFWGRSRRQTASRPAGQRRTPVSPKPTGLTTAPSSPPPPKVSAHDARPRLDQALQARLARREAAPRCSDTVTTL